MISERDMRKEVERIIKEKYTASQSNVSEMESLVEWIKLFAQESFEKTSVQAILQSAARMIYRLFEFNEIVIGLRSESDGLYRAEVILGHTREAEAALRKIAHTKDEMKPCKQYPGLAVSKFSEFSIREDKPYTEEEISAFNRPALLNERRKSAMEMGEGDYLDVYMLGERGEIIGWIELSNPRDKQLPDREVLRSLELMSEVMALAIQRKDLERPGKVPAKVNRGLQIVDSSSSLSVIK